MATVLSRKPGSSGGGGGGAPSGPAGGDLSGTYPNPAIAAGAVDASKVAADIATQAELDAVAAAAQPADATLTALAAANWAANAVPVGTGADTLSQTAFAASTILARLASGNLKAASVAEIITLLQAYTVGGTDVAVADGGTGASTAAAARTNLGLVIGTDVAAAAIASFNGQAGVIIPTARGWSTAGNSWLAARVQLTRFVLSKDFTVTSMVFRETTVGTGNIDVGIYDAAGTRLASSGSTAGKKGANTTHTVPLSATLALTAGTVYYAAAETDTTDGAATVANFSGVTESFFGTTMGVSESMFKDTTFPLPASIATPTSTSAIATVMALV